MAGPTSPAISGWADPTRAAGCLAGPYLSSHTVTTEAMEVGALTGRTATASRTGLGLVVVAALALAGCSSGTSAPSPAKTASAQAAAPPVPRIATDNDIALDALIAVGATPACATGATSTSFDPLLMPYTSNVTNLGESVQGS